MDLIQWLQRGQRLNEEIEELLNAKQKATALAVRSTSHWGAEKVSKSRENSTEEIFANVADLSLRIDEKVKKLTAIKGEILDAIDMVEDIRLRTLLIARYVNQKTWDDIAQQMHYSDKWVRTKLHGDAIAALEEALAS